MCKFSIIVPVYNVETYLEKCLNSILDQDFDNYEVIIINDGSTDNSRNILKRYEDNKKITIIDEENKGLSAARNNGVEKSTGDYLIFVDSDDYIASKLLNHLSHLSLNNYELIKIQYEEVYENGNVTKKDAIKLDKEYNGQEYFLEEIETHNPFEMAWLYIYNRKFWIKNDFSFREGTYHEDFGLIPLIILKAKNIYVSSFVGYYYNQIGSSIMRSTNYEKNIKKANDYLVHFDYLYDNSKYIAMPIKTRKYFNSYLANGILEKYNTLKKEDKKIYLKEIKKRKIANLLIDDSLIRKIKKIYMKIKY